MRIIPVTEENAPLAGAVHSASWQASHRHFCPEEFVLRFDARRQTEYLLEGMRRGKQVWLLIDPEPAGLISLTETGEGSLIEDLYVLPECEGRGYGGALLKAAGLAASSGEGNRLIDGGGVRIDGTVVSDKGLKLEAGTCVVQVGKRKFARVKLT